MNLVSMAMQILGPMIINKIAGSLGINQGLAGKAIAAIIPAILAGLAGKAATPSGASDLFGALGKQDTGMLGNLGNLVGGAGQQSMIDNGSSMLGSLLGGSSTSALAGAVGKFTGIGGDQSKSLIGMLAPVVLGTLAQQTKSSGLDAGGLGKLLAGQKDNIAAAMPPGFSELLGGSGLLDGISDNLKQATGNAASSVREVAPSPSYTSPSSGTDLTKYLLPGLAALAALYLLLGNGCQREAEKAAAPEPAATTAPAPAPGAASIAGLTNQATTIIDKLKSSIGGVKNEATAKAALPGLTDVASQLATLKGGAMGLSADARHPLVAMIGAAMPGVASSIDKVMAIPGVSAVLKPVLDQVMGHLGAMAKG